MTLDKAIELIQADIDDEAIEWDSPLGRAYKLSFEALKRTKKEREIQGGLYNFELPGETPD